jgi:hypothetical protein
MKQRNPSSKDCNAPHVSHAPAVMICDFDAGSRKRCTLSVLGADVWR